MKKYFILIALIPISLFAKTQYVIVDPAKIKEKQEYNKNTHVMGKVLENGTEKDGQLKLYVRGCGKVTVPKNSKGEAPKVGQSINVTIKDRCKISDWL